MTRGGRANGSILAAPPPQPAKVIRLVRPPLAETLIADCGHPQWPFWQLVMAILISLQVALWFQSGDLQQLRPRPAPVPTVRAPGARATRKEQ